MRAPRSTRLFLVAAVLASSGACQVVSRPPASKVDRADSGSTRGTESVDAARREILGELERYYTDFSARDWTAFSAHFWPGAVVTTIWQPPGEPALRVVTITVPDFVARAPNGPGSKPIFEEKIDGKIELRLHTNLVQAWVPYAVRFGDSAKVDTWKGYDAITLMRHENRWRIASIGYTDR